MAIGQTVFYLRTTIKNTHFQIFEKRLTLENFTLNELF